MARRGLRLFAWIASALVGAACEGERDDVCPVMVEPWAEGDFEGFQLRCDRVPELCDLPVESRVAEADLELAIDVVFVGDGYEEGAIEAYRERVTTLVEELSNDRDTIVGRDPGLFNFHRVDLVTATSDVESRPLRSCVTEDGGAYFAGGDDLRVARAAANAPDVDLVVVITAGSSESRGNAGQSVFGTDVIRMRHENSYRMLTHEMGHALVGLGDEYVDFERRHYLADKYETWTGNPLPPNLSLSPDEDWGGLVEGAVEGGGRFAYGVYRPTNRCLMLDSEAEFCPVCSAAIDDVITARRGRLDGPPRCGLAVGHGVEGGPREVAFYGRDGNGLRFLSFGVDGQEPIQNDLANFRPLAPRLPVWFEIGSSLGEDATTVSVTCVDDGGETSTSTLDLAR